MASEAISALVTRSCSHCDWAWARAWIDRPVSAMMKMTSDKASRRPDRLRANRFNPSKVAKP